MKPVEYLDTAIKAALVEPPIAFDSNRKSEFVTNSFQDDAFQQGDIVIFGSCNGICLVERGYIPEYLAGMRLACYAALVVAIIEGIIFAYL